METNLENTEIEQDHGHCADLLMSDYGIPRERRVEVCHEVAKAWMDDTMFHFNILASVRGRYKPANPEAIDNLRRYLNKHRTHEPRNHEPYLIQ